MINTDDYTTHLTPSDRQAFHHLDATGDYQGAFHILVRAQCDDEAYQYGVERRLYESVALMAAEHNRMDMLQSIVKQMDALRMAELFTRKGFHSAASVCYLSCQAYEKAARASMKAGDYETASKIFEQIDQYMNAIMCSQKAGNKERAHDLAYEAFRHDLELADGDMEAVQVSKALAIHAGYSFLNDPATFQKGLAILEETNALQETVDKLEQAGKIQIAAMCAARLGDYMRAMRLYESINDVSQAIQMAKLTNDRNVLLHALYKHKYYPELAKEFIARKHYDDALEVLKRVETSDPRYPDCLELQGDVYCRKKHFEEATICYDSLLRTHVRVEAQNRILYKAAYSYEMLGKLERAYEYYQRVYDNDPNFHGIAEARHHVMERLEEARKRKPTPQFTHKIKSQSNPVPSAPQRVLRRSPSVNVDRPRINSLIIESSRIPAIGNERYGELQEIAHGGMGVVYKATDQILMRTVALKVLSQKLKDNDIALEYFMREARASAALQHINIVTVYDIGSFQDGTLYLAMEFVDGKTLKQLVTSTGPFPTRFLVQLAMHTCRGLQYAHEHGIVHRDIKSSNLMLTKKDKTLKILDFGLAKVITEIDKNSTQAIGTPYYMSPEQIQGTEIDNRSDVYSLGVTLFELATGQLPFTKGDLPYKHVHEQPPMPHSIYPAINPDLEKIILKMLAKAPNDRFPSCQAVIQALKNIRSENS